MTRPPRALRGDIVRRSHSRLAGTGAPANRLRWLAAAVTVAVFATGCELRPVNLDRDRPLALRSTITASNGTLLARLFKQNRALVDMDAIPKSLIHAVLAAEDADFFEHPGFDLSAMARAALVDLRAGEIVQGGSTITQQYVKNTYFRHPGRTLARKARELRIAMEVERRLTKNEILDRYLNTIYLGQGAYGVEAASETYFKHGVKDLTLAEAALLAGLIRAPGYYDPRRHPARARARRNWVINRMASLERIGPAKARRARRARLGVTPDPPRTRTREPYFVEAVKREILLDRRLGVTEQERARALWQGGLHVETTMVPRLQEAAERSVARVLNQPGDPAAALIAIRPRTGEVVAMVGGRDWSASQVNLALGEQGGGSGRQAGSAFKAIDAAAAMEAGITLSTQYESSHGTFVLDTGETWWVANAEGNHSGPLSLEEALVQSVNGVYARLALDVGAPQIATQARRMGVRSKLPLYPSIALGSAEVSVLDMAAAYATLANRGTAVEPTTIRRVRLPNGEILEPEQKISRHVVSPGNAYLLTHALRQVIERGTGTAADIGRPAAGKTGTTDNYTDAWFVGYTPQLVTAVWVGYPHGAIPMTNVHGISVFGGTFPALIWRQFMLQALRNAPVVDFEMPKGDVVEVEIDPETGLLAAPWCPGVVTRMLRQLVPKETCPAPPPPAPPPSPTPAPSPTEQPKAKQDKKDSPSTKSGDSNPSPKPSPSNNKGSGKSDKPGSK